MTLKHWFSQLPLVSLVLASGCVGFINDDGDEEVGDTDGDTTDNGDGDGDGDMTIYAIQEGAAMGTVADGTQVSIKGVTVTAPISVEGTLAYVEEPEGGPWSGISLYLWDEVVMGVTLQPGDVVDVIGEYTEFYDNSQIVVKAPTDITIVSSGASLPGPDMIAPSDTDLEQWEGVRVQVQDVTVEQANDGFGQYVLQGGLKIGNLYVELPGVQAGATFSAITGPLAYSFEEFKLVPIGLDDLEGLMGGPDPEQDTSIVDVQMGSVAVGTYVKLEDVIVSSPITFTGDTFFVQEPEGGEYSGLQAFVMDPAGLDVAPGDVVTLVGTIDEYFDMTQIEIVGVEKVTVTSSGPAPTPELIADPSTIAFDAAATAEPWEGVLVQIENVTVTNDALEFGEFEVSGGVRVDDVFFEMADWTIPAVDTAFTSIAGPLYYGFEAFKIGPRDAADLVQ